MIYQVLIIDDEEIVCRGLAQFVKWKNHGFEVAGTAYSVDDALALIKNIHVDVVFMDIRMPGKTGLDLLQILQKKYPEIKSVIMSGFSNFSYAQEALRYNAVDYLTKPVNLGEVEALLDRLRANFEQLQQEALIHTNRVEALLLSAAKGYADGDFQGFNLPRLERWYGLSMALTNRELSEIEIHEKKEQMRQQITIIIPYAILLEDDVFSLFCIFPSPTETELDSFIAVLEQFCPDFHEWGCGVSKFKYGLKDLHTAWVEAGRALRYHRAGARKGIVLYQNIETLFSQTSVTMQDILPEILQRITNSDTRKEVLPLMQETLTAILRQNLTVVQYQTSCIRFLIELNSYLQGLDLPNVDFHPPLNDVLGKLLLCWDYRDSIACITSYMQWLIGLLNRFDEQQLGKGVIRDVQLFIRQHYSENISLNSLAEQFFLHPNYLSRLFKEKTGKNFVEYLTEVRMEKVKNLLKNTDSKIIEICALTGYDNPRYFSKVFKQHTGMTPREFREQQDNSSPIN